MPQASRSRERERGCFGPLRYFTAFLGMKHGITAKERYDFQNNGMRIRFCGWGVTGAVSLMELSFLSGRDKLATAKQDLSTCGA